MVYSDLVNWTHWKIAAVFFSNKFYLKLITIEEKNKIFFLN